MQPPSIMKVGQIKQRWDSLSEYYQNFDACMQTFYYTLVHILNIREAHHILEIACGAGKLLPYAVALKRPECTYLATDLSEKMVEAAKKFIAGHIQSLQIELPMEEWCKKMNLEIKSGNGEQKIQSLHKFDRIICNLVLQITEDPTKMLANLANCAEKGCLLGLTIWGDRAKSNFLTLPDRARTQLGLPIPNSRTNFHTYNRIPEIAEGTGWEIVTIWEQNAPFPFYEYSPVVSKVVEVFAGIQPAIVQKCKQWVKQCFERKQHLNFAVQMAILRKIN